MTTDFKVGDRVSWNSEAGRISGRIVKVHTSDFDYKGYTHHATPDEPQYEIKSDKTDHIVAHKGSALRKIVWGGSRRGSWPPSHRRVFGPQIEPEDRLVVLRHLHRLRFMRWVGAGIIELAGVRRRVIELLTSALLQFISGAAVSLTPRESPPGIIHHHDGLHHGGLRGEGTSTDDVELGTGAAAAAGAGAAQCRGDLPGRDDPAGRRTGGARPAAGHCRDPAGHRLQERRGPAHRRHRHRLGRLGPALRRPRPAQLHPFRPVVGARYTAPATPGDLLFHIRARHMDMCFELASVLMNRLAGHVDVADEVHAFQYFDHRDLLGFVDGTASPKGAAAVAVVTVGNEDPAFAGGSYVMVQKYLHDLEAWNALTVEEQEQAFGRHKLSNIEFPDKDKASNSHLKLNTIVDANGVEHDIVRDNMPFGRVGTDEYGTYYIGYAADLRVMEEMLRNMFIGKPPGNHDRILDFSTAVTGGLFFVPTADFLNDPSAALTVASTATADETTDRSIAG